MRKLSIYDERKLPYVLFKILSNKWPRGPNYSLSYPSGYLLSLYDAKLMIIQRKKTCA